MKTSIQNVHSQDATVMSVKDEVTPFMQQYFQIKDQHLESLLLFQVGDFYELFFDDAKKASATLGITLTTRGKNKGESIPLCGVPVHSVDHYIGRLISAGFKVAICSQLEEAVPGRTVSRGVTQVLTPGTLTDTRLLDSKSASYLLSFFEINDIWGLLFGELMTAQLFATIIKPCYRSLENELTRFFPDEIILAQTKQTSSFQSFFKKNGYYTSVIPSQNITLDKLDLLAQIFFSNKNNAKALETFQQNTVVSSALFYFHSFVSKNQPHALEQEWQLQCYTPDQFLHIDAATQKNLELVINSAGGKTNTVFTVLDKATTPMGSRLLKKWLFKPLVNQQEIEERLDIIALLKDDPSRLQVFDQLLRTVGDIERVIGRIALKRAVLNDYKMLSLTLAQAPHISKLLLVLGQTELIIAISNHLQHFSELAILLAKACNDDPTKEYIIAIGFDNELDQLRALIESGNRKLVEFEREQQERTGINSLKVGYTNIHGYYIEVSKTYASQVPSDYVRYQTLVGKERYIVPALQQMYVESLKARLTVKKTEELVFERVKYEVARYLPQLRKLSHALANLDLFLSMAKVAYQQGYVRPQFDTNREITISQGRHPVVEQVCSGNFIPNDIIMRSDRSFFIITGPNMGGKSTYLRQVALICLMAQCGSFVPAHYAKLAIFDRIFTRIGAGDNLAQGKSTFLVEMEETAAICINATKKSLVILDEVGRGTSTIDGLAIAQSVIEYLHEHLGIYTLFATHYHELTSLADQYQGIVNCHAASKPTDKGILFLYKIIHGIADQSFGVHVARAAQLPPRVIARAQELVKSLSSSGNIHAQIGKKDVSEPITHDKKCIIQPTENVIIDNLKRIVGKLNLIDCDGLSPRQAHEILRDLQQECKNL